MVSHGDGTNSDAGHEPAPSALTHVHEAGQSLSLEHVIASGSHDAPPDGTLLHTSGAGETASSEESPAAAASLTHSAVVFCTQRKLLPQSLSAVHGKSYLNVHSFTGVVGHGPGREADSGAPQSVGICA